MTVKTIHVRNANAVGLVVAAVVADLVRGTSGWAQTTLREASAALATEIQRQYAAKAYLRTDDAGIKWKASKAAEKRHGLTMIDTGHLIESIAGRVLIGAHAILSIRANADGSAPYAKYVLEGTKNKDGSQKLPPRPAWPTEGAFPDSYRRAIAPIIAAGIRDEIARRLVAA